jgi:hypothetical protein
MAGSALSTGGFFNGCTDAAVGDRIAHGFQRVVIAVLNRVLSLAMDQQGTLFGLLGGMAADLDQGFDHPFERIDLVVPHDQAVRRRQFGFYRNFFLFPGPRSIIIKWPDHGAKVGGEEFENLKMKKKLGCGNVNTWE